MKQQIEQNSGLEALTNPSHPHLTVVFDNVPLKGSFRRIAWLTTSFTHKSPFRELVPT
jgi:hypothetical protein